VITQPLVRPPPGQLITAAGPVVACSSSSTLGSLSGPPRLGRGVVPATHGGPHPPCSPGTRIRTHTGFPFTTGSVFVQQTTGTAGDDFFTLMGSDQRTLLGAGYARSRRR
jgi:hypothetical protein